MEVSEMSGEAANDRVLLTAEEVGIQLRLSPRYIRTMAVRGELASVRVGKLWRFRPADVDAFVASLPNGGGNV